MEERLTIQQVKRMKIPKRQSEAVNGRKTDNSTVKRIKIPKSEAVNGRKTDNSTG